jgi:hypothetical protein
VELAGFASAFVEGRTLAQVQEHSLGTRCLTKYTAQKSAVKRGRYV